MRLFAATEAFVMKWCAPIVKRWRASVLVTTLAIALAFILLLVSPDLGELANLFLVIPVACIVLIGLLVGQSGKTKLVCLMLLFFYVFTSWQLTKHWMYVRSETRWLVTSRSWKAKVSQQPLYASSGLRAVVWDGWGMFAQDTDVYLIYDPSDGLRDYSPSELHGLPCPVWKVQRLEKQWYSVTFFTNYSGCDGKEW